ncbi:MAG: pyridoxamine 5'-phosphate oxidase [Verrucomicrobia bacterium]|nr:pyridoxamine 5'-phosphate oxidase [Verrucomicrobiota bacterium]MCH8511451.1 pyridoxamine 5'-phosphate oxidase [Kiritimatiellia bacterium]
MFGLKTLFHAAGCVSRPLLITDLEADPIAQFNLWLAKGKRAGLPEPTAMALATVGADGVPSQRMVLLKHISKESGVMFYTNYGSQKAREIDAHPSASVLFHQHVLQRQIRITGTTERATREESEAYFKTRPRDSQLGAWASKQSEELPDRDTFEARFKEVKKRFEGQDIPCPEFWGGYRLIPSRFEFWQGRAFRLHDRFVYTPEGAGWKITRLYP